MDHKRKHFSHEHEDDMLILAENENVSESKRLQYLSYTERYFTKYYKLDVKYECNDHLVLMHSNKVAVCTIAPTHPILDTNKYKVKRVEFIQHVNEEMSGKHKHFAKNLHALQPICKIYCDKLKNDEGEEAYFVIYCCLNAKLIEINEKLLVNPELIQDKPVTEGFLCILMPKLDNLKEQLTELISHAEYTEQISQRAVGK